MSAQPGAVHKSGRSAARTALVLPIVLAASLASWAQEARGVPEFLPGPEARDQYFADLLAEEWVGKTVDELIAHWGEAKKSEIHPDGRQSLLYRMQFTEGFQLTPTHYVALSAFGPSPVAGVYFSIPGQLVPKVVGKLKARFHVDASREIVEVDVLYLKWTRGRKRHKDDEVVEEPIAPAKPFKTDVEVPRAR